MAMSAYSGTASIAGTITLRIQHAKSGIVWVVKQMGIESVPSRSTALATVTFNGRYFTSTSVFPSTASGAPYLQLNGSDILEVAASSLTFGDNFIVSLYYEEVPWGTTTFTDVV